MLGDHKDAPGFLLPKESWDFADAKDWPSEWMGKIEMKIEEVAGKTPISVPMAWAPYLLLAAILVATRVIPELKSFLLGIKFGWADILGEKGVSGNIEPLYLPGGILVIVVLITFFLHRMHGRELVKAVGESSKTLLGAGFVLIFTIPMVRILINSGVNAAGLSSMPVAMAQLVADSVGSVYPFFAPWVGALGAYIAGSNTVSNLMLSQFQFNTAGLLGVSGVMMVALQSVGAAAGNMIAIHNVVAASATVGLLGREGTTLRKTILPTLYYLILAGSLGLIAMYALGITDPIHAAS